MAFSNAGLELNEESHLDNDGHTPLNIAIMNNDVELVALLIELGEKVTIKNRLIHGSGSSLLD
ncbi:hypothetical protein [Moritella sp. JT01]|uniref:hypothetical protein n=1 Tax=Moritella sp. JT01 TaxID=756698 RepID=UPI00351383E9